eukprot:2618238-Alexandrium_andersonii.AAC.1
MVTKVGLFDHVPMQVDLELPSVGELVGQRFAPRWDKHALMLMITTGNGRADVVRRIEEEFCKIEQTLETQLKERYSDDAWLTLVGALQTVAEEFFSLKKSD